MAVKKPVKKKAAKKAAKKGKPAAKPVKRVAKSEAPVKQPAKAKPAKDALSNIVITQDGKVARASHKAIAPVEDDDDDFPDEEGKPKKRKMKTLYCSGRAYKRLHYLVATKQDFIVSTTNRTTRITHNGAAYVFGAKNGLKNAELNLYMSFKRHVAKKIEKEQIEVPVKDYQDVSYFMYSDMLADCPIGTVYDTCISFDVNKAYYKTARILGFIDEDMYQKCLGLDKAIRLRLIGCLATKKRKIVYREGKPVEYQSPTFNPVLRSAWFNIVDYVDKCLTEFAEKAGDRFLFYWVDGIYLIGKEQDYKNIMRSLVDKYGLDFKTEDVDKIEVITEGNARQAAVYKSNMRSHPKRKYKPFFLEKPKNDDLDLE